jgi:bacterioferritin-associated ferredoxin
VVAVLDGSPLVRKMLRRPLQHGLALWGQWNRLAEGLSSWLALRRAGVPFSTGWGVLAAHGQEELSGVSIARLDDAWRPIPGTVRSLACDTLCISYGFVPATELARLLGVDCEWRPEQGGFVPLRDEHMETNIPGVFAAGECAGIGGAGLAAVEGHIAGLAAAAHVHAQASSPAASAGFSQAIERLAPTLRREQRFQQFYAELFTPGPGLDELAQADTIVCRCEEVTSGEIVEAIGQSADTLDAVKVLTRCGMGNCQGRVCGPSVAALVAHETGQSRAEVGQFHARPPVFPVPLPALNPTLEDQPIPDDA